ncbi:stomatin family protein [Kipferlia bialata]|uniref:Stomatin family protein n=1 Tax=Kipferlia bialata TaxID=797122 RepID=A0A9K3CW69_9EUKA|nr:stomatin family protein [Kipferlia bialata]|eukprot:g3920.t1
MSDLVVALLIVFGILLLIGLIILCNNVVIIHQAEAMCIERLGRFNRVLEPGIHFLVPLVERPREFHWRRTEIGVHSSSVKGRANAIRDRTIVSSRIDLREDIFNFLRQEVYTKDTVQLNINCLMLYNINNVRRCLYEVEDLQAAIFNTAQTQLKEVFGELTFSQALSSQAYVNAHLMKEFGGVFSAWGVEVHAMELLELVPDDTISRNLKKQMVAERTRRGQFIRSEGEKEALNLRAEGDKGVRMNLASAEQESMRKRSEGQRESRIMQAKAEAQALQIISNSIMDEGDSANSISDYLTAERYFKLLIDSGRSKARDVILPYDPKYIESGYIKRLPTVFGVNGSAKGVVRAKVVKPLAAELDDLE